MIFEVTAAVLLQLALLCFSGTEDPVPSGSHPQCFLITQGFRFIFDDCYCDKMPEPYIENGKNWNYPLTA